MITWIIDFLKNWLENYGLQLIVSIVALIIFWWLINKLDKIIIKILNKSYVEKGMVYFLSSISKYTLRIFLIAILLGNLGVNMVSVMTALGASLVTVGFALKDSMSNMAGGIILVVVKPFKVGDYIETKDAKGIVSKIEIMFTTLEGDDGKSIIIPNTNLISNTVTKSTKKI